jgi:glyoxylase-like metal-dependent hydrolase (beta-lactamase superfamily II)
MKFVQDIYVYEWTDFYDNNCNSFYIGGGVQALIDPGLTRYVPSLLESMKLDGIQEADIRYVINTHSHPDHFEGSAYFAPDKVKIAMHADEIAFLNGEGGGLYGLFGLSRPAVDINMRLKEGSLVLGEEAFEIILIPGHSPGSVGLYWTARKALFCGDVIFDQSVGRTDFPGGSGAQLKESIRSLAGLDIECLFPGHMGMVEGAQNVQRNFKIVIQQIFPYI